MMKPTSKAMLINGKQGAADQGRGSMGRKARLLLILPPPLFSSWGGRREEEEKEEQDG